MCDALHYLLDNIFIRSGSKLYRHIEGIPMDANCLPICFACYERAASWDGRVSCTRFFGHYDLDLVSRIIVSGAYLLYYLKYE